MYVCMCTNTQTWLVMAMSSQFCAINKLRFDELETQPLSLLHGWLLWVLKFCFKLVWVLLLRMDRIGLRFLAWVHLGFAAAV